MFCECGNKAEVMSAGAKVCTRCAAIEKRTGDNHYRHQGERKAPTVVFSPTPSPLFEPFHIGAHGWKRAAGAA